MVDVKIAIGALIPILLLLLAAHRIRSDSRNRNREFTGILNPFTQLLLCLGLGKLFRVPHITDDLINPVLRQLTGVANIMSLAGMTFGALAAIPIVAFSSYITGRRVPVRAQIVAAALIVIAMTVTFLRTPMADTPTSFMSNQFAVTGPVIAYWTAFIAPLAISTLVSSSLMIREALWVRRGPFARALAGMAATFTLGFIYCCHKVLNLALKYNNSDSFLHHNAVTISNSIGLAAMVAAASSAATYAWYIWKDRIIRYQLLRRYGGAWMDARTASPDVVLDQTYEFRPTRRVCWAAARSHEAAYRLQIELADHQHQTRRSSILTSQEAL
ncbi:hypothetical protein ABZ942_12655 [Nocardia sp. NPDC046473]|uniref:hypothetical protein n=1 Tax=Nocardia sp. NPDC046473 TaxID=3155733 RepID=UPI0033C0A0CA